MTECSFTQAIYRATERSLQDELVHFFGLGATYGVDGTINDLAHRYPDRVHDIPNSECADTGECFGASLNGLKIILHHGRIEFALYAGHFILTEAANWQYLFPEYDCYLTIRIAMGRNWGHGPTHTRNHKTLFTVPGLKVVCPSSPQMAYSLLRAAVDDNKPVIFLENRWLYKTKETVDLDFEWPLNKARVVKSGKAITVVGMGDSVLDILKAQRLLPNIDMEIIDLVSINPIDEEPIVESVTKTGQLFVVETSTLAGSVAMNIVGRMSLACRPLHAGVLGTEETPTPTAPSLCETFYPTAACIANGILDVLGYSAASHLQHNATFAELHLPPSDNFDTLLRESNSN